MQENEPGGYEVFSGELEPIVYDVEILNRRTRKMARIRVTARQFIAPVYYALGDTLINDTMCEDVEDPTGVRGPDGIYARKHKLKKVVTKLEGADDMRDGETPQMYIDRADEFAWLAWGGYRLFVERQDASFRLVTGDVPADERGSDADAGATEARSQSAPSV